MSILATVVSIAIPACRHPVDWGHALLTETDHTVANAKLVTMADTARRFAHAQAHHVAIKAPACRQSAVTTSVIA